MRVEGLVLNCRSETDQQNNCIHDRAVPLALKTDNQKKQKRDIKQRTVSRCYAGRRFSESAALQGGEKVCF